ncbi:hypothetical protein WISP_63572 [Willisornis vidua]|uniref:Uncharacterized protein n=1 Tax=Willisornis vidua TaxID=1566151 RepID=A0ABQ9DFQ0_9PASS|nr:hypothetical protein WISP_63572 [Willisornis vidua]
MARRALKLASLTAAASGIYVYGNKFLDPNDFGVVRVGRAIATTAVITYDYLTSLRSVPYGTEEYEFLKSQHIGFRPLIWVVRHGVVVSRDSQSGGPLKLETALVVALSHYWWLDHVGNLIFLLLKRLVVAKGESEEHLNRYSEEAIRKPLKDVVLEGICIMRNILTGTNGKWRNNHVLFNVWTMA